MQNSFIAIKPLAAVCSKQAKALAEKLNLPLYQENEVYSFLLIVTPDHLEIQQTGKNAPGSLRIDFLGGKLAYRLQHRAQKELLAKAIGLKVKENLSVLDVTAGLGRDSFLLATLGYQVLMLERSAVIAALLQDGLERALKDPEYIDLNIKLLISDSKDYLQNLSAENFPDVIYLDPMYPEREKSALVKKEMRYLQALVGKDEDADKLLELALTKAKKRVVVKRPRLAKALNDYKPHFVIEGKNVRFDVYLCSGLP